MKLELDKGIKNRVTIVGFVKVKEFHGEVTRISTSEAKRLVEYLKLLEKNDFITVAIGVEKGEPLLVFIDDKKTMAYAVATYIEDGE